MHDTECNLYRGWLGLACVIVGQLRYKANGHPTMENTSTNMAIQQTLAGLLSSLCESNNLVASMHIAFSGLD